MKETVFCIKCDGTIEIDMPDLPAVASSNEFDDFDKAAHAALVKAGWYQLDPMVGWCCKACEKAIPFTPTEIAWKSTATYATWKRAVFTDRKRFLARVASLQDKGFLVETRPAV